MECPIDTPPSATGRGRNCPALVEIADPQSVTHPLLAVRDAPEDPDHPAATIGGKKVVNNRAYLSSPSTSESREHAYQIYSFPHTREAEERRAASACTESRIDSQVAKMEKNLLSLSRDAKKHGRLSSFSRPSQSEAFLSRLTDRRKLEGHAGCVNRLAWHEEGRLLASVSDDRQCLIWDLHSEKDSPTTIINSGNR
ncbi:WD domain, G-beta repeat protein [Toxoplasma gondii p89]|uniref:WD domain, G-beta repeat protein n=1 Tax=Toxoplasma gondii p89 TaxID=943119 RepID=A0A086JSV1_TOXGO|nr:WD domain, G-beta repeat protein [Toxoplasma gondii p89]